MKLLHNLLFKPDLDLTEAILIKNHVRDSLDLRLLQETLFWPEFISNWVGLYTNFSLVDDVEQELVEASKKLMQRMMPADLDLLKIYVQTLSTHLVFIGHKRAAVCIAAFPFGINIDPKNRIDEKAEVWLNAIMNQHNLKGTVKNYFKNYI